MKNNYLAKQDHFILAHYDFNLESSKLLFACLYKANSEYIKPIINEKSHIYKLDFEEIKRISGIEYDFENHPDKIKRATLDLTSKIVQFTTARNSFKTVGIVKSFDIIPEKKILEFEIDNDLKPYLVEQFKEFTKLGFDHLSLCESKYTFRLYEILITKAKNIKDDIKTVKISVAELGKILQFPETQSYGDLKKRVLKKAHIEYNALDIKEKEEQEEKKLFKSFEFKEIITKQRGKGRNPVTDIIFEFELLEKTKLLLMSKLEKIKTELDSEDWIMLTIRELLEKNRTREPFFQTLEINYIHGIIILTIENIKKEYGIYGNLNQNLIRITLENAFTKFIKNKNNNFEAFLLNGFRLNCNFFIEKNKNLVEQEKSLHKS